jgi:hypothetical protein
VAERKRKRRKAQDKRLALHIAASILAASALASLDARPAAAADPPFCAPHTAPGSAGWDDLDGCWERRPDGGVLFRTGLAGRYYYHAEPPSYSRYAPTGGHWFGGGARGGGYHGAPSASA